MTKPTPEQLAQKMARECAESIQIYANIVPVMDGTMEDRILSSVPLTELLTVARAAKVCSKEFQQMCEYPEGIDLRNAFQSLQQKMGDDEL